MLEAPMFETTSALAIFKFSMPSRTCELAGIALLLCEFPNMTSNSETPARPLLPFVSFKKALIDGSPDITPQR